MATFKLFLWWCGVCVVSNLDGDVISSFISPDRVIQFVNKLIMSSSIPLHISSICCDREPGGFGLWGFKLSYLITLYQLHWIFTVE
jgi:hypothetical protein